VLLTRSGERAGVAEFAAAHKFGVAAMSFYAPAPTVGASCALLVSIGVEEDGAVHVWSVPTSSRSGASATTTTTTSSSNPSPAASRLQRATMKRRSSGIVLPKAALGISSSGSSAGVSHLQPATPLATGRVSERVLSVAIAPDASCFITAGVRHLQVWQLPASCSPPCTPSSAEVSIEGVPAKVGAHKDKTFVEVACGGDQRVFTVTQDGLLLSVPRGAGASVKFVQLKQSYVTRQTTYSLARSLTHSRFWLRRTGLASR